MFEAIKQAIETRVETDSMGEIEVPTTAYWGAADAAVVEAFQYWIRYHAA